MPQASGSSAISIAATSQSTSSVFRSLKRARDNFSAGRGCSTPSRRKPPPRPAGLGQSKSPGTANTMRRSATASVATGTKRAAMELISAGGGSWYSGTLGLLHAGDLVWVKAPGYGFVGVGRARGGPVPASDFKVTGDQGVERPALEVLTKASYHKEFAGDPERQECFVPIEWPKPGHYRKLSTRPACLGIRTQSVRRRPRNGGIRWSDLRSYSRGGRKCRDATKAPKRLRWCTLWKIPYRDRPVAFASTRETPPPQGRARQQRRR